MDESSSSRGDSGSSETSKRALFDFKPSERDNPIPPTKIKELMVTKEK